MIDWQKIDGVVYTFDENGDTWMAGPDGLEMIVQLGNDV